MARSIQLNFVTRFSFILSCAHRAIHWSRRENVRSDKSGWIEFSISVRNVSYAYSIFWKIRTYANVFYFSVRVSSSLGGSWMLSGSGVFRNLKRRYILRVHFLKCSKFSIFVTLKLVQFFHLQPKGRSPKHAPYCLGMQPPELTREAACPDSRGVLLFRGPPTFGWRWKNGTPVEMGCPGWTFDGWSRLIWHNFVKVADNWIRICSPA